MKDTDGINKYNAANVMPWPVWWNADQAIFAFIGFALTDYLEKGAIKTSMTKKELKNLKKLAKYFSEVESWNEDQEKFEKMWKLLGKNIRGYWL